jgi:Histidine kinase-, DNA gyrase B-, and HSP90-like ATPase
MVEDAKAGSGRKAPSGPQELVHEFSTLAGGPEDKVQVDITYDLIRQFSHQLYTNPRKAIEELVCNSYDAGASECYVRTPRSEAENLLVLDNGVSMNLKGIHDLWTVGVSPKEADSEGYRVANNRSQIGKFGVGKLAAFALGKTLTHVAAAGGWARIVQVAEDEIKGFTGGTKPTFNVYRLEIDQARSILEPALLDLPSPWKSHWKTWTLAIVSDIEGDAQRRALHSGFLKRMITHALPLSAQFNVFIDGESVPLRTIPSENVALEVPVTDPKFIEHLESTLRTYWREQLHVESDADVPSDLIHVKKTRIKNPGKVSEQIDAIEVPRLGPVAGSAIMTRTTLTRSTVSERGYRDHGFRIYVHGKLANPEDELFGITQRSLKYWYRFRAELEIPSLDKVLLVQRNSFSEGSELTYVAREVLRAIFGEAKARYVENEAEETEYEPAPFGARLRFMAPYSGQLALKGLTPEGTPTKDLNGVEIGFAPNGPEKPVAQYLPEKNTIQINEDHPVIAAMEVVEGSHAKQLRQVIAEVGAGTILAGGYLQVRSVDQDIVDEAAGLIDDALRSAAGYIRDPVEDLISDMEESAETGGTAFETAVVRALRGLRLSAARKGGPELPDGVVEIPIAGGENLRIAVETKGSKHPITHEQINPAALEEHQRLLNCSRTIVVAKSFQTEGRGDEGSVLLRISKQNNLPLIPISAIAAILRLHRRRPFTHSKLVELLLDWRPPAGFDTVIERVWRELPDLGTLRLVLELAWEAQSKDVTNFPEPGMILVDARIRARKLERGQLVGILEAVRTMTGLIEVQDFGPYQFRLEQDPETILEAMTRAGSEDPPRAGAPVSKPEQPPKA